MACLALRRLIASFYLCSLLTTSVSALPEGGLQNRIDAARSVVDQALTGKDGGISNSVLAQAVCVAVVAAQIDGSSQLHKPGVITCRSGRGWSGPVFLFLNGSRALSMVSSSDIVLIAVSSDSVRNLSKGDVSIVNTTDFLAGWRTYIYRAGVFSDVDLVLNGAQLIGSQGDTSDYYGQPRSIQSILNGDVSVPVGAKQFVREVARAAFQSSNAQNPVGGSADSQSKDLPSNSSGGSGSNLRKPVGAEQCAWPSDFDLIRDREMFRNLQHQDFAQLVQQGGISIDRQITTGEATLAQISSTLPTIQQTISGISSPTVTHFNFRFDYAQTCQQNPDKDALLAAECQHVNVENTRYALNGTLQIMDCLAGRPVRASIGPNPDASMPQDELPGAVNSARVPTPSCSDASVSGDTGTSNQLPPCHLVNRPGTPRPGDKITH